jgi:hypothetical protein
MKTALPFEPPIRKPRCYISCRPAWMAADAPDLEVEAKPFATLHRAVLPGHPTDAYVIKVAIPDPKLYPEGVAAIQGREIHMTSDFETAISLLSALGLGMCRDEEERGEGKVLPATVTDAGAPAPTRVTKVRFREGFFETSMEFAENAKEDAAPESEGAVSGEEVAQSNREGGSGDGGAGNSEPADEGSTYTPEDRCGACGRLR